MLTEFVLFYILPPISFSSLFGNARPCRWPTPRTALSMDTEEFRERGKAMVEYMCEYMESLPERRVTPSVEPGYLRKLLPPEAPVKPESWDTIMADVNSKIMPGVS